MENEQPSNKIDSITQFLTVHNTTIIAVIMAISAMLGQSYQQQEEAVHETQEDFEDKQADLKSIELMYGENSAQYQNSAQEYQKEEVKLLEEAMEAIDFDTSGLIIPKAEGRLPQQTEGGGMPQEGTGQQPQEGTQQEGAGQQPQGYPQQEGVGQPPQGGAQQQQPAQNAQLSSKVKKVKDIEEKFKAVVESAETQSSYSDYATTILQISVLLSSIGVSVANKFLSYLASGFTLVGVILEIAAAVM